MAVTLADIKANSTDKLVQGFISELITDNYMLDTMQFDNCMTSNGISDLVYKYKRVKTGAEAKFRALNDEPAISDVVTEAITTSPGILSTAWKMDRVAADAANDLYALKLEESKNSIIRGFNKALINGDTTTDANGFDGLAKALDGSSTEFDSAIDFSTVDQKTALAFASEMDTLLSSLCRTPDVILTSSAMHAKMNAAMRAIGLGTITMDEAGKRVSIWDGIRIEELRDGALATNDIYAACLGMEDLHGITLVDNAIRVAIPDWTTPGAVKTGDAEFVCGIALRKTTSAGVLHPKAQG